MNSRVFFGQAMRPNLASVQAIKSIQSLANVLELPSSWYEARCSAGELHCRFYKKIYQGHLKGRFVEVGYIGPGEPVLVSRRAVDAKLRGAPGTLIPARYADQDGYVSFYRMVFFPQGH